MTTQIKPMLAKAAPDYINPKGWWMSEKLDGIRAIWTGEQLVSRNGKVFLAPEWFTNSLPKNVVLDGELFEGRGQFQKTVGKVRSAKGDWSNIKFKVFDVVNGDYFEGRQESLKTLSLPSHVEIVEQTLCESQDHLNRFEAVILGLGGEGVMLREAWSAYEQKRSASLLKVKRFQSDEASVIGYEEGQGKYAGMLGALICKFAGGVFKIGTGLTDNDRITPPAIGSQVTFSFFELTDGGLPRFPVFVANRDYEGLAA